MSEKEPFPKPFDKEATLRWAASGGHIETAKYLIKQGAEPKKYTTLALKLVKQQIQQKLKEQGLFIIDSPKDHFTIPEIEDQEIYLALTLEQADKIAELLRSNHARSKK